MAGIFKAYDIRGLYGQDLTEEIAERIGRALAVFLNARRVVVGRDMRSHSPALQAALARGLAAQGADVLDIGLCSTPMVYFATGRMVADAGVMVTASHNPAPWNGFKLCRRDAAPISAATGIRDLEQLVTANRFPAPTRQGQVTPQAIGPAYARHIGGLVRPARRLRVVVDYANAMGTVEAQALEPYLDIDPLFAELDGTFPNHEANPLKPETLAALQAKVRAGRYSFGIAFDGDADRVGFVDERGAIIPMDIITALIARMVLAAHPNADIFYDLRSSRAVAEVISESGGRPHMSRVGHAFIKQQMRDQQAIFAGELSGHYYFRDNYYTESAALAVLYVADLVSRAKEPLSALIRPLQRYAASGELNSEIHEAPAAVLARLRQAFPDAKVTELDGLTLEYPDWWFNVRSSNTEPLIRLNLEADTQAQMEQRRDEVLRLIRG